MKVSINWQQGLPTICTDRLRLSAPLAPELPAFVRFLVKNRDHIGPWVPAQPDEYFTETFWQSALPRLHEAIRNDKEYRFALFEHDGSEVIGVVLLRDVRRGPRQLAELGYLLDKDRGGEGLMNEALRGVISFAFDEIDLHRLEAYHSPLNEPSGRVLQRLGFRQEGLLREEILIRGEWRDHILSVLTNKEWRGRFMDAGRDARL